MARKCASAAILETLRDPRVVTMAPGAQLLWIRLITAMQNSGISVLQFGSDIMNQTGIALFIQIAETEIDMHLPVLIDRGLMTRAADGALACPMLKAQMTRAEINRANGLRGGRPRKTGDAPPGQTHLMLPIDGGAKTEITKTETERQTEMAGDGGQTPTYLLKESSIEESSIGVSDTEFREIGLAALAAAGFDPARSVATYGIVRQWLADGADRAMILEVIAARMKPGITTLNYFTKAIADAIKTQPRKKERWEKEFDIAMANFECYGRGVEPMPRVEDFKLRYVA